MTQEMSGANVSVRVLVPKKDILSILLLDFVTIKSKGCYYVKYVKSFGIFNSLYFTR